MFWEIVWFIVEKVGDWWYTWIYIMMTIESSFIPFPSEVAMIPAWYLSSLWKMNIYFAFLAWTLWALTWASINYFLWKKFGWPFIKNTINKYGKYIFLSLDHYNKAEMFFQKHGGITTFNGRLIPGVRQLISIPAWVFKMNFIKFIVYTTFWAWIWNIILLMIWYIAWENKELISRYSNEATFWAIILIILISIIYYFTNRYFLIEKKGS